MGAVGRDADGKLPTAMVWTTAPVEAFSSVTVLSLSFATQTWVPSEETPKGMSPRRWSGRPPGRGVQLAHRAVVEFATQTWVPSDETPKVAVPTAMVWTTAPVEAFSSVTVPRLRFVTQTWVPSEETPSGVAPR